MRRRLSSYSECCPGVVVGSTRGMPALVLAVRREPEGAGVQSGVLLAPFGPGTLQVVEVTQDRIASATAM